MDKILSYLPYKGVQIRRVKNKTLILQVLESNDLKCLKEETNITKSEI